MVLDTQSLHIWIPNTICVSSLTSYNHCAFQNVCEVFFYCIIDSSFVSPLVYAFMGSSRDIAIGPVVVVSLLLGSLLENEIDPSKNPVDYRRLAFTTKFFARITQFTLDFQTWFLD